MQRGQLVEDFTTNQSYRPSSHRPSSPESFYAREVIDHYNVQLQKGKGSQYFDDPAASPHPSIVPPPASHVTNPPPGVPMSSSSAAPRKSAHSRSGEPSGSQDSMDAEIVALKEKARQLAKEMEKRDQRQKERPKRDDGKKHQHRSKSKEREREKDREKRHREKEREKKPSPNSKSRSKPAESSDSAHKKRRSEKSSRSHQPQASTTPLADPPPALPEPTPVLGKLHLGAGPLHPGLNPNSPHNLLPPGAHFATQSTNSLPANAYHHRSPAGRSPAVDPAHFEEDDDRSVTPTPSTAGGMDMPSPLNGFGYHNQFFDNSQLPADNHQLFQGQPQYAEPEMYEQPHHSARPSRSSHSSDTYGSVLDNPPQLSVAEVNAEPYGGAQAKRMTSGHLRASPIAPNSNRNSQNSARSGQSGRLRPGVTPPVPRDSMASFYVDSPTDPGQPHPHQPHPLTNGHLHPLAQAPINAHPSPAGSQPPALPPKSNSSGGSRSNKNQRLPEYNALYPEYSEETGRVHPSASALDLKALAGISAPPPVPLKVDTNGGLLGVNGYGGHGSKQPSDAGSRGSMNGGSMNGGVTPSDAAPFLHSTTPSDAAPPGKPGDPDWPSSRISALLRVPNELLLQLLLKTEEERDAYRKNYEGFVEKLKGIDEHAAERGVGASLVVAVRDKETGQNQLILKPESLISEQYMRKINALEHKLASMSEAHSKSSSALKKYQTKASTLEIELATITSLATSKKAETVSLAAALKNAKDQLSAKRKENLDLQQSFVDLQATHEKLKSANALDQLELENAKREWQRALDVVKHLEDEVQELKEEVLKKKGEVRRVKDEAFKRVAKEEGRREGFEEGVRRGRVGVALGALANGQAKPEDGLAKEEEERKRRKEKEREKRDKEKREKEMKEMQDRVEAERREKESLKKHLEEIQRQTDERMKQIQSINDERIAELLAASEERVAQLELVSESRLLDTEKEHHNEMRDLERNMMARIREMERSMQSEVGSAVSKMRELEAEKGEEVERIQREYGQMLERERREREMEREERERREREMERQRAEKERLEQEQRDKEREQLEKEQKEREVREKAEQEAREREERERDARELVELTQKEREALQKEREEIKRQQRELKEQQERNYRAEMEKRARPALPYLAMPAPPPSIPRPPSSSTAPSHMPYPAQMPVPHVSSSIGVAQAQMPVPHVPNSGGVPRTASSRGGHGRMRDSGSDTSDMMGFDILTFPNPSVPGYGPVDVGAAFGGPSSAGPHSATSSTGYPHGAYDTSGRPGLSPITEDNRSHRGAGGGNSAASSPTVVIPVGVFGRPGYKGYPSGAVTGGQPHPVPAGGYPPAGSYGNPAQGLYGRPGAYTPASSLGPNGYLAAPNAGARPGGGLRHHESSSTVGIDVVPPSRSSTASPHLPYTPSHPSYLSPNPQDGPLPVRPPSSMPVPTIPGSPAIGTYEPVIPTGMGPAGPYDNPTMAPSRSQSRAGPQASPYAGGGGGLPPGFVPQNVTPMPEATVNGLPVAEKKVRRKKGRNGLSDDGFSSVGGGSSIGPANMSMPQPSSSIGQPTAGMPEAEVPLVVPPPRPGTASSHHTSGNPWSRPGTAMSGGGGVGMPEASVPKIVPPRTGSAFSGGRSPNVGGGSSIGPASFQMPQPGGASPNVGGGINIPEPTVPNIVPSGRKAKKGKHQFGVEAEGGGSSMGPNPGAGMPNPNMGGARGFSMPEPSVTDYTGGTGTRRTPQPGHSPALGGGFSMPEPTVTDFTGGTGATRTPSHSRSPALHASSSSPNAATMSMPEADDYLDANARRKKDKKNKGRRVAISPMVQTMGLDGEEHEQSEEFIPPLSALSASNDNGEAAGGAAAGGGWSSWGNPLKSATGGWGIPSVFGGGAGSATGAAPPGAFGGAMPVSPNMAPGGMPSPMGQSSPVIPGGMGVYGNPAAANNAPVGMPVPVIPSFPSGNEDGDTEDDPGNDIDPETLMNTEMNKKTSFAVETNKKTKKPKKKGGR
ncbi:hypothetical protein BKA70DRAFT_1267128 [Coprinopsis sp. MPI-PUGE-AT-0042]|nr:hypothetical protein BKA70DRAFT_1267128 [Coprinopsis sp. MPI-PUGE-AT-0042]